MTDEPTEQHLIRLQRYLAACGVGSRRHCEEYITAGRVTVDGKVASELGTRVDPQSQTVTLDGQRLKMERKKYFVLNKPPGVVCTNRDQQGRPRVIDLFPPDGPRLFTVGRLDENSEGLLIVTNDGDLAQKLAHPKYRIYRTYEIQVAGIPTREQLQSMQAGIRFSDGLFRIREARFLKAHGKSSLLQIILTEGQNRELRRLFAKVGHKVQKLKRVAFGPIRLSRLPLGTHRELTREELAELLSIVDRNTRREPKPGRGRVKAKSVPRKQPRTSAKPGGRKRSSS